MDGFVPSNTGGDSARNQSQRSAPISHMLPGEAGPRLHSVAWALLMGLGALFGERHASTERVTIGSQATEHKAAHHTGGSRAN